MDPVRRLVLLGLGCLSTLMLAAGPCGAEEPRFTVIDLGTWPNGWGTEPRAINNKGEVAGITREYGGICFAFLYRDGRLVKVSDEFGVATALNDRGEVLGVSRIGGRPHATLWRPEGDEAFRAIELGPGSASSLNATAQVVGSFAEGSIWTPRGTGGGTTRWVEVEGLKMVQPVTTSLIAINDRAQVIGSAREPITCAPGIRGFLWHNGETTELGTLGGDSCQPTALNAAGQVVGSSALNDGDPMNPHRGNSSHAFLWEKKVLRDLGTLGAGRHSKALGINATGDVVGWSSTTAVVARNDEDQVAFLFRGGTMLDLNRLVPADSGWTLFEARAINDRGQVVGMGRRAGKARGFLLTPR